MVFEIHAEQCVPDKVKDNKKNSNDDKNSDNKKRRRLKKVWSRIKKKRLAR